MKIFLKKKNLVIIALAFLLVVLAMAGIYFGLKTFWRKKADINPLNNISNTASVSYHVGDQTISDTSNTLTIQKVDLFNLALLLQGRANQNLAGVQASMVVIDPAANNTLGNVNFTLGQDGSSQPDWTVINAIINTTKLYDLRISIGGYLSKKVRDVNLEEAVSLDGGTFLAGDVDGNGVINWDDYNAWSRDYGKTRVGNNETKDFNGDGVINYLDFAIAYGSSNWLKTENSQ